MNLDIGSGSLCGHKPMLDDSYLHADIHKTYWNRYFLDILCDIQHLPFRNFSFNIVNASHVLEHLDKPLHAIEELIRVSNRYVVIKVPHILGSISRQKTNNPYDNHKTFFRRRWFQHVLKHLRFHAQINYKPFLYFFNRPYEIEITILL